MFLPVAAREQVLIEEAEVTYAIYYLKLMGRNMGTAELWDGRV